MDLYCQRCGEPFDFWHVQQEMDDEIEDFGKDGKKPSVRFKDGEGCPCCNWGKAAPKEQSFRSEAMGVMFDMLGDDVDGAAAMMDDFEYAGMFAE